MVTYKFEQFNIEIVDPIITVDPIVKEVNPQNMTIKANIVLETTNAKFGILLENISVIDLNYDAEQLKLRVLERLETFIIS